MAEFLGVKLMEIHSNLLFFDTQKLRVKLMALKGVRFLCRKTPLDSCEI